MTDTFILEINGLDELETALAAAGRDIQTALTPALEKAMRKLWELLPSYPERPAPGEASKHWTDKQRRWFFAALARGEIEVPYKRRLSGGLGGSLSTEVRSQAGALVGLMGPSVPYAQHVIGKGRQAAIHQGRWWILEDEVEQHLPEAVRIIEAEVARLLTTL